MGRLALLLPLFLAACAEVPTAAITVDERLPGATRYTMIPDGAVHTRPPAPRDEVTPAADTQDARPHNPPRIVVTRYDASRSDNGDGTALCPFDVQAHGFPAVNEDGTSVAYFTAEALSSSDGEDELVLVSLLDIASDTDSKTTVIVDGDQLPGKFHCWRLYRRAREQAARLNAAFSTGWRSMEHLPLDYEEYPSEEDALGPHARPVEMTRIGKEVVVRIPGVKVLARAPADWQIVADKPWEGGCWFEPPVPAAIWADRETGIATVEVMQTGGPCFCYASTAFHPLLLPVEAFDEIDRRNLRT